MASQWFYQVMGEQVGPVSSSDLRNLAQHGTLSADTLVRKAPSSDWVLAERVQGLLSTPTATTPHPPVTVPAEKRPSAKAPLAGTAGSQPNKQPATSERDNSEANPTTKRFSPVLIATAVLGSLALVVLVAILITAHKSPTVDAMQTEPSVLSVNGTVLKVRVWSNVLYQAAGKGEDPTESFIRQAKAIESAVKETERLGHVVEKDSDAVNEAARVRNATMDEAVAASNRGNSTLADSLEQKADGLNTDWEEKHKQYDRDCQRFDDWGKHIDEMKKEFEAIEQEREVYKARTTLAPIRYLYKSGSGWKDAVPGAGMGNDLYVPVDGKPKVLQITIGNSDVCSFAKNDRGEYCLVPVTRGKTVLSVAMSGHVLEIPIEVIILPCNYGDTTDQIIGKLGVPDNREVIGGVERWTYDRWPKAVLIISSDKTLFTVKTAAAHPGDWNQQ